MMRKSHQNSSLEYLFLLGRTFYFIEGPNPPLWLEAGDTSSSFVSIVRPNYPALLWHSEL
jgi:hypothetical protein